MLKTVTQAGSPARRRTRAGAADLEALLGKAFAGMDAALLQAVQANQRRCSRWSTRASGCRTSR